MQMFRLGSVGQKLFSDSIYGKIREIVTPRTFFAFLPTSTHRLCASSQQNATYGWHFCLMEVCREANFKLHAFSKRPPKDFVLRRSFFNGSSDLRDHKRCGHGTCSACERRNGKCRGVTRRIHINNRRLHITNNDRCVILL